MLENITRREKLKGTDPPATYANRHTLTISPEIACSLVLNVFPETQCKNNVFIKPIRNVHIRGPVEQWMGYVETAVYNTVKRSVA